MFPMRQWQEAAIYLHSRARTSERGSSIVEYALLVLLIAIACLVAVTFLGDTTSSTYDAVADSILSA